MKLQNDDKLAIAILLAPTAPFVYAALCWAMGV